MPVALTTFCRPSHLAEHQRLHNAFHQGQYAAASQADLDGLSSPDSKLAAQVLTYRARLAAGDAAAVVPPKEHGDDWDAVRALALLEAGQSAKAAELAGRLAERAPENASVQVLGATVLVRAGEPEKALALLAKHQGSLDA